MRVIKSDSGFRAYQEIFQKLQSKTSEVVLWQVSKTTGKRNVFESRLKSFKPEMGYVDFEASPLTELEIDLSVYCYCKDVEMIFKASINENRPTHLRLSMPLEIQMLDQEEVAEFTSKMGNKLSTFWSSRSSGYSEKIETNVVTKIPMHERSLRDQEFLNNEFGEISIDEEEKMYAGKRESPRSRPKIDKWVKVRVEGFDDIKFLKLFDLSRGGMSFLVLDPLNFPKGSAIEVLGFEEFDLDDPLVGQIMSQRSVDANQIEFKIGIKFAEGQD